MSVRGDIGNDRDRPPCTYGWVRGWPDACASPSVRTATESLAAKKERGQETVCKVSQVSIQSIYSVCLQYMCM